MSDQECCGNQTLHPDYMKELNRLSRIGGQVEGVKKMVQDRRYCPDILIQLRAIRAAVSALEASILETHLDSCVTEAFASNDADQKKQKIAELKELYRKYSA